MPTPSRPRLLGVRRDLVLTVAMNLFLLTGVMLWGWPAGNILLLFWVENVVLGVVTAIKMATAREPRIGLIAFFLMHYGIFCLVHLAFTTLLAFQLGVSFAPMAFLVPVVLLVLRYTVDLVTVWFAGQRHRFTASELAFTPYPRILVLHFVTILTFFLVVGPARPAGPRGANETLVAWVQDLLLSVGVFADERLAIVFLALLVKTVVETFVVGFFSGRAFQSARIRFGPA